MTKFILNAQELEQIEKEHNWICEFNEINSRYNCGACMYLYKKYGCPATYQEFYDKYTTDEHKGSCYYYGRTPLELKNLAKKLQNIVGDYETPLLTYYKYIVKKLIVCTLDGAKKEKLLKEKIEAKGALYCTEPTPDEDASMGIDYFVHYKKDGSLAFIAQCKPNSFFRGNYNDSLIRDRITALEKEKKCNKTYNVPVLYFIYDKVNNEFISKENGSIAYQLQTLIDNNGKTI